MGLATFKGGIHPFGGKELAQDKPVTQLQPSAEMVFPLSQHIGSPATPLVTKGDQVLVGQKIGESSGMISACVISSVSGTVKAIEPRIVSNGLKELSIVVENDGAYQSIEGFGVERDSSKMSKKDIRDAIREAGIVGLGGAGFPTHVKLTPKDDSKIDYILVNGAECEPYLTSDYRRMIEEPKRIISGLKVVLQLFENAQAIIGVEDNKPDAIKSLTELVKDEPKIKVMPLSTKYPQGGERPFVYALTRRKLNSDMLPFEVGCIVQNIETILAIDDAVCHNIPLIQRALTISGDAIANPMNVEVRFGTNYQQLLEAAGGFCVEPEKVISGGPMMGQALFTIDIPVTKNSSSLLAFSKDMVAESEAGACIRCGRCSQVCPSQVIPQLMMVAAQNSNAEMFEKVDGMECCDCGCCTYTCPAKLHLTQSFREMRKVVLTNRKKVAEGKHE